MKLVKKSIVLTLFIFIFMPIMNVTTASSETYEVSPEILHIREEPARSAPVVGVLQKGDRVTAFAEEYGWVQTYYAGEIAWVAKHHLSPVNSSEQTVTQSSRAASKAATIIYNNVIIRSGPSQSHDPVASTSSGMTYQILNQEGDWLQVQLTNGNTGWIASWLTSTSTTSKTPSTNKVAQPKTGQPLTGYNIVIDAGHGGRDPGAIGLGGILEKNLVTPTAAQIASTLRQYGATVIETRTGDYYVPLEQRVHISNSYFTDAFLSIHYDAFPVLSVQGTGAYYVSESGRVLAHHIHQAINHAVELKSRSTQQANYRVLRDTNAPAILLELGFITNPYDLSIIQTDAYQTQVAEAIAAGLINYFRR